MTNCFTTTDAVDFWVWVNPDNWLVRHQISFTGGFTSAGLIDTGRKSNLMFIPNPAFQGTVTPFSHGVMRDYMAEYNLELSRERHFRQYPSRLNSIYLFQSEMDAHAYSSRHKWHVGDRILKKCHSVGIADYSLHDCSWVDFLRQMHMMDQESIDNVGRSYWNGTPVNQCTLQSLGVPWTRDPIVETLFIGRVEFYDRNLER